MGTIEILGGDIARHTAAINLKQVGIDVKVNERKHFSGVEIVFKSDLQQSAADIIATAITKPTIFASGIKFNLNHLNKALVRISGLPGRFWYYLCV